VPKPSESGHDKWWDEIEDTLITRGKSKRKWGCYSTNTNNSDSETSYDLKTKNRKASINNITKTTNCSSLPSEADDDMTVENANDRNEDGSSTSQLESLAILSYWESTAAEKLFRPKENETVLEAIERRINLLRSVNGHVDGWMNIVIHGDEDEQFTDGNIFKLRQQAQVLCLAYTYAREKMNEWTWVEGCINKAIEDLDKVGLKMPSAPTVRLWHIEFLTFGEKFIHPNSCGSTNSLHPIMKEYPELKM
jgi:hypothetical protein